MDESAIRISMLEQRWAKPTSGDLYEEDVICDFPQSGERIRGRANLVAQRSADPDHPSIAKVLRIMGSGSVWVSEVDYYVRRKALVYGEHPRVSRRQSVPRNAVLRATACSRRRGARNGLSE